jgi:hypothetical protein
MMCGLAKYPSEEVEAVLGISSSSSSSNSEELVRIKNLGVSSDDFENSLDESETLIFSKLNRLFNKEESKTILINSQTEIKNIEILLDEINLVLEGKCSISDRYEIISKISQIQKINIINILLSHLYIELKSYFEKDLGIKKITSVHKKKEEVMTIFLVERIKSCIEDHNKFIFIFLFWLLTVDYVIPVVAESTCFPLITKVLEKGYEKLSVKFTTLIFKWMIKTCDRNEDEIIVIYKGVFKSNFKNFVSSILKYYSFEGGSEGTELLCTFFGNYSILCDYQNNVFSNFEELVQMNVLKVMLNTKMIEIQNPLLNLPTEIQNPLLNLPTEIQNPLLNLPTEIQNPLLNLPTELSNGSCFEYLCKILSGDDVQLLVDFLSNSFPSIKLYFCLCYVAAVNNYIVNMVKKPLNETEMMDVMNLLMKAQKEIYRYLLRPFKKGSFFIIVIMIYLFFDIIDKLVSHDRKLMKHEFFEKQNIFYFADVLFGISRRLLAEGNIISFYYINNFIFETVDYNNIPFITLPSFVFNYFITACIRMNSPIIIPSLISYLSLDGLDGVLYSSLFNIWKTTPIKKKMKFRVFIEYLLEEYYLEKKILLNNEIELLIEIFSIPFIEIVEADDYYDAVENDCLEKLMKVICEGIIDKENVDMIRMQLFTTVLISTLWTISYNEVEEKYFDFIIKIIESEYFEKLTNFVLSSSSSLLTIFSSPLIFSSILKNEMNFGSLNSLLNKKEHNGCNG